MYNFAYIYITLCDNPKSLAETLFRLAFIWKYIKSRLANNIGMPYLKMQCPSRRFMYDSRRRREIRGGCLSGKAHFLPSLPVPLSLRAPPPLVSCPAGMVAKLISLLQIRQRNCSRNGLLFSLCTRSPGSLKGTEGLRNRPQICCAFFYFASAVA